MVNLYKLLDGIKILNPGLIADDLITDVTDDSREVRQGGLFIASKGAISNGMLFINDAIERGAKVIISEKDFISPQAVTKIIIPDIKRLIPLLAAIFFDHPSKHLKTIGITGTNGKTTVSYLVESILTEYGVNTGVIGTINHRFRGRILKANNTTPGSVQLNRLMDSMRKDSVTHLAMEASSHALDQGRLDNILFDAAVFTNITSDHMDYHENQENYFNAKAKLFDKLKDTGRAVLNIDDERVASLRAKLAKNISFGMNERADISAYDVRLYVDGSEFMVRTPSASFKIGSSLTGTHNVSNILASIATAISIDIPQDIIIKGVASLRAVPGRLESVREGQNFNLFIDFAHTEDALKNVLSIIRRTAKRRIITVFGCGGDRDKTKRPLMGRIACYYSDRVIVTSDNPRSEDPGDIAADIESGILGKFDNYDIIIDRKEAIYKAIELASKDDVVLIAGKGHEDYQIIGNRIEAFSDREAAKCAIISLKSKL